MSTSRVNSLKDWKNITKQQFCFEQRQICIIQSDEDFCIEVWGNTYMSNIKPLFVLQKRAVRIIHNVDFREHTKGLFIKSGLLKLKELIELQTLLVMCKTKCKILPENYRGCFCLRGRNHRGKLNFKRQFARTHLKQMCISVVGAKLWNSLENDEKSCSNIFQFKKMYRERIRRSYEIIM